MSTTNEWTQKAHEAMADDNRDLIPFLVAEKVRDLKVLELARRQLAQEAAGPFVLPDFVTLDEFLAIPDTSTPYLVESLWPKDGRVVFAAQNKAGKSTARDNIVKSLVDGYDFLNKYQVHMPADGRIVVIDDELHENQLRRWMRDHSIGNQNRVVVVPMRGKAATFDLTQPDIRAKWVAKLRGMNAAVVILDCLRPVLDALGLSEDKDAGKFLVQFDALLNEAGVHEAMVIHHMGHSGERSRGDSRILDWPDAVWSLVKENPDDPHSARYFKAYGRDVEVYESLLSYDELTRTLAIVGGSRTDAAAAKAWPDIEAYLTANPGASKNAIEEACKGDHPIRAIRRSLKEAIAEDWVIVEEGGKGKKTAHHLPNLDTSTHLDTTSTSNSQDQPRHLDTSSIRRGGEVVVNDVSKTSQDLPPVEVP
jgi:AAA domain